MTVGDGDPEIGAMQAIAHALAELEEEAQHRVLEWAGKRYGVRVAGGRRVPGGGADDGNGDEGGAGERYEVFADLLDAANPKTEDERALVAGYWFQVVRGGQTFTGAQVNDALKDTGQGVGNIARSLGNLQRRTPAYVRQVSKSGRTKQARKTYKLTTAGIRAVASMTGGRAPGEPEGDTESESE